MKNLNVVSFLGCGNVGKTLGLAMKNAGYQIGAVVCKHLKNAREAVAFIGDGEAKEEAISVLETGALHFIVTNDDAIERVIHQLASDSPPNLEGHYFFHVSGSLDSTVLAPLKVKGAHVGSIHPLQVFADPAKALESLPGTYYALEGEDRAMSLAVQIVDQLQGKLLLIPTGRKVLYHIAGVFAANYLTVLVDLALAIMEGLGEAPEDAYQAFLPLMVGALQSVEEFGTGGALTGPISRGDVHTIQKHLEAMRALRPEVAETYSVLGRAAVDLSARAGKITGDQARELTLLLQNREDQ